MEQQLQETDCANQGLARDKGAAVAELHQEKAAHVVTKTELQHLQTVYHNLSEAHEDLKKRFQHMQTLSIQSETARRQKLLREASISNTPPLFETPVSPVSEQVSDDFDYDSRSSNLGGGGHAPSLPQGIVIVEPGAAGCTMQEMSCHVTAPLIRPEAVDAACVMPASVLTLPTGMVAWQNYSQRSYI
eukprot:gene4576-4830_t